VPIIGSALDHVAVAVERWSDAWPRYVTELGGRWSSGGANVGFAPAQLAFANGARLEVLQPWQNEANPFLRRFLDSNGPGPHHLTFKVPDIDAALATVGAAGITPVSVDLSDPGWKEAFLHPREAFGTVVQLAQAAGSWQSPPPEGFPTGPASPADLVRVTHAVDDLPRALALFVGLLGGTTVEADSGSGPGFEAATVSWGGPLELRLVTPAGDDDARAPLAGWLGGRPGRVHHLAFVRRRPQVGTQAGWGGAGQVPGVFAGEHVAQVVDPQDNHGTRLVVLDTGPSPSATGAVHQGR
jgi:catechol 2,3-dioxygenase-like lactoylglutathione lyase family enzyme